MSEKIVQLNEEVIKGQLKELVRGSVEETLNELLEAEAEKLTQAARYERNEQRQGEPTCHYNRNPPTPSAGHPDPLCPPPLSQGGLLGLHPFKPWGKAWGGGGADDLYSSSGRGRRRCSTGPHSGRGRRCMAPKARAFRPG